MKRYSDSFIKRAREIREKKILSFVQLGEMLNVPSSTVGNWCKGTVGTRWDTIIINNERKRKELKESEISVVPSFRKIGINQAKLLAGLLYGCEGSKYPAQSGVAFSNSEPNLVLTFVKLLRKSFELDESKFSAHLQIHTNHRYEDLRRFWADLLKIPESCFIKPTVREPKGGKHRDNYIGTCTIRYRDYRIQLKLLGIFEKFIDFMS